MELYENIKLKIQKFLYDIKKERVSVYAAQAAFFLILSFFPLTMLILSALKIIDADFSHIYSILKNNLSEYEYDFLIQIIKNFSQHSKSIISVNTLLYAWSSGKAFYAISESFYAVLHTDAVKGYFFVRLRGLIYSLLFVAVIVSITLVGIFGSEIIYMFLRAYPSYQQYFKAANIVRKVFIYTAIFVIVIVFYRFLPNKKYIVQNKSKLYENIFVHKIGYLFCSAGITSVLIYLYTSLFSVYVTNILKHSYIYGGFSALISVMLWLYGIMYTLILGFKIYIYFCKSLSV